MWKTKTRKRKTSEDAASNLFFLKKHEILMFRDSGYLIKHIAIVLEEEVVQMFSDVFYNMSCFLSGTIWKISNLASTELPRVR